MPSDGLAESRQVDQPLLSILIALYNEEAFIAECLTRVLHAPFAENTSFEIIVVDDGSSDASVERVHEIQRQHPCTIRLIRHDRNRGKGAAIRTALEHASGAFCIIQDADLEYSPLEYPKLLKPLLAGDADAVIGSRFGFSGERRVLYFWHAVANRILTTLCDMVADINLTDMETCYKAARTPLLKSIPLRCDRFGIEPELIIKLAQRRARIYETSISYHGRTYEEGKKIGFKDACKAFLVILYFGLLKRDIYKDPGAEILDTLAAAPRFNGWMADTVRPFLGDSVMEVGAGIGNLAALLCQRRKRYIASDIDAEHLAYLSARLEHRPAVEVVPADLERPEDFIPYTDQLDSVLCLNVLEHVKDDYTGLSNIFRALRPGGRAIVLVPEGMSVFGTLDEVLGHQRRYSEKELRDKLQAAGFRIETVLYFNRPTRPGWFVNGRIFKRRRFSRVQIFVFDRLVWLWRRIDRFLPWKPTSLIAVGIRPS
ncbi:MAG: glycosyltransferase [Acidobacteriaceae bacterium]|nr:glycosyltransferase [Acidobacteriaceae bacterium]MBV9780516.1 glycosyltransferase [Acidobacteriaceae bacterium]